jgi:hypothetical protein
MISSSLSLSLLFSFPFSYPLSLFLPISPISRPKRGEEEDKTDTIQK